MSLPSVPEVIGAAGRALARDGRVALCQIVRTQGSTPGRPGWKLAVTRSGAVEGNLGGGAFEALVVDDARAKLAEARPQPEVKRYYLTETAVRGEATGMVCGGFAEVFLEVLMEKPLLVVCGGGPVGQALARNAVLCDFDVLVAEDRPEYRRPELFPPNTRFEVVDRDYSRDFLEAVAGRDLYAAVVTRCWETDLAALGSILRQAPAELVYLGLMGSLRKVERVREELRAAGLDPARLRAPIGLEIGGETPGELAVSILAEVISVRRTATAGERPAEAAAG